MDKRIQRLMEQTITNFSKTIRENNPQLTWATLFNLSEVLTSYVDAAWAEYQIEINKNTNKGKANDNTRSNK